MKYQLWITAVVALAVACDDPTEPPPTTDGMHWPPGQIDIVIDPSVGTMDPDAATHIKAAFYTWVHQADIPITFSFETRACDAWDNCVEAESPWEWSNPEAAAITDLVYVSDGIKSASIIFNTENWKWSTSGEFVSTLTRDIQTAALHEAGHVLGLIEHSDDPEATMFAEIGWDVDRTLSQEDIDSVRELYNERSRRD